VRGPALRQRAQKLRRHSLTSTSEAGSGHPTTCMSCAEIMSVLYFHEMRFDPKNPKARNVDEFVLSKGHGAPILCAALKEAGAISDDLNTLRRIDSPLEIRFYALLNQTTGSDSLPSFAGRVDQLLSAYQQEGGGRIKVIRYHSQSDSKAAAADGIKPFNLDKGDACYLGLAVVQNRQKESLPQLTPEWEQALESDLSRAIARLLNAPSSVEAAAAVAQIDAAVVAEVKRQIPNFASVSVEEGAQILRRSALNDFKALATEMELQVKEAEQRVQQAQNGKSEAEQQASLKQLQQVRADHAVKLKEITARSAAQTC